MSKSEKGKKTHSLLATCIFLLIILILGAMASIHAYLSDGDKAVNKMIIGGVNVEIVENFVPPSVMEPGTSFTKNVSVRNLGPSSAYVRLKAVFTDSDMGEYCTVDYNTADWLYNNEDGYWYYIGGENNGVVDVGEMTESLFTNVSLDSTMDAAAVKDFDIIIYTEGFQARGFVNYEDAWTSYEENKPSAS